MVKSLSKKIYLYLIFFFLYAPILILIVFSFNGSKSRAHWTGFTLSWYGQLFHDQQILTSLYNTLIVAVISSLFATVIGTAAAIGISRMRKLPKAMIINVTYIPVLSPDIVTGISLMLLFVFLHIPLGFITMLMAHITFNLPFVILAVLPKLKQLNSQVFDAALDLGATPMYAYKKVILPEIMPGVITGFLLAFTLSIDDFVISFFTTGSGFSNLAITIYSMARRGIKPEINALLTLMFISILLLLLLVNYRMSKDTKNKA
ncbi:MAG: ABC transporter permease subunit [Bacillota bacterium]|nr:ABC transporter permease subunit [Bacillota bacterium]